MAASRKWLKHFNLLWDWTYSRKYVDRVVKMAICDINKKYFILFRSVWLLFHNKEIFHTDCTFPTKFHCFFYVKKLRLHLNNFQDPQPIGSLHKICYTNFILTHVTSSPTPPVVSIKPAMNFMNFRKIKSSTKP